MPIEIVRHTMRDSSRLYLIEPEESDAAMRANNAYVAAKAEVEFMSGIKRKRIPVAGSLSPSKTPAADMASALGWTSPYCRIKSQVYRLRRCDEQPRVIGAPKLDLLVLSTAPKVFLIENLLSEYECDHVVAMGRDRVARSSVGQGDFAYKSKTRTSETGWLYAHLLPILNRLFERFAEVIGVADDVLNHDQNAENLQVVHYTQGQEYTPHHDFGYTGSPHQRFLTLLVYVDPAPEGGGTSFPKAYGDADSR